MYIILNGIVSYGLFFHQQIKKERLRVVESLLAIVIIIKLLYFMTLFDNISPLVNTIWLILGEIGWFMLILVIFMLGFATSIYLVG